MLRGVFWGFSEVGILSLGGLGSLGSCREGPFKGFERGTIRVLCICVASSGWFRPRLCGGGSYHLGPRVGPYSLFSGSGSLLKSFKPKRAPFLFPGFSWV